MPRKIFRSGHSRVVSLPPDVLKALALDAGDRVTVTADVDRRRIVITPVDPAPTVRSGFLDDVDRFIDRYRPALDKLNGKYEAQP